MSTLKLGMYIASLYYYPVLREHGKKGGRDAALPFRPFGGNTVLTNRIYIPCCKLENFSCTQSYSGKWALFTIQLCYNSVLPAMAAFVDATAGMIRLTTPGQITHNNFIIIMSYTTVWVWASLLYTNNQVLKKGQPLNNGQNTRPQRVHFRRFHCGLNCSIYTFRKSVSDALNSVLSCSVLCFVKYPLHVVSIVSVQ